MTATSNSTQKTNPRARLYHAASSYYSMIARLALEEARIPCERVAIDIHAHMDQFEPAYVRLNPNMTVPTLVLPTQVIDQSRDIMEWAFAQAGLPPDAKSSTWLDRLYAFPIDQLTFGWLLSWNPLARALIPTRLAATQRRLEGLAAAHPDLAALYEARAAVFAERTRIFDSAHVRELSRTRRSEAVALLDELNGALADGKSVLVPPRYGCADVVLTVFLARLRFVGLGREVARRPAAAAYYDAVRARPSFEAADIWSRLHPLRMIAAMATSHWSGNAPGDARNVAAA